MIPELSSAALLTTLSTELSPVYDLTHSQLSSRQQTPFNVLLAYSGGLDSHVLLHLLSQIPTKQIQVRAIYINHGLQTQAYEWSKHCETQCALLNIPYETIKLDLAVPKGSSTEDFARKARYQALKSALNEGETLLTAHHQNDQAETVLLQLFRGAGVQGLAAMPVRSDFNINKLTHLRPLLGISRKSLDKYAKTYKLNHIEDPSNQDTAIDRNFLRQNIMPLLRERWLGIDKTIARSANIQAETKLLLDEIAADLLPSVLSSVAQINSKLLEKTGAHLSPRPLLAPLDVNLLKAHSPVKQRLLLRYWISQQGFSNPTEKKLAHIFTDLIEAAEDKQPLIEWRGVELRRYQQAVYIMSPLSTHDANQRFAWDNLTKDRYLPSLNVTLVKSDLTLESIHLQRKLTVCFRQGGERLSLSKRGKVSLKKLFQALNIPPWLRSRIPLIYQGEDLVCIVGIEDLMDSY